MWRSVQVSSPTITFTSPVEQEDTSSLRKDRTLPRWTSISLRMTGVPAATLCLTVYHQRVCHYKDSGIFTTRFESFVLILLKIPPVHTQSSQKLHLLSPLLSLSLLLHLLSPPHWLLHSRPPQRAPLPPPQLNAPLPVLPPRMVQVNRELKGHDSAVSVGWQDTTPGHARLNFSVFFFCSFFILHGILRMMYALTLVHNKSAIKAPIDKVLHHKGKN